MSENFLYFIYSLFISLPSKDILCHICNQACLGKTLGNKTWLPEYHVFAVCYTVSNSGIHKTKWSKISSFPNTCHFKGTLPKTGEGGLSDSNCNVAAKEMTKKPDATKIAMLLSAVGPDALACSDTTTSNDKKVKAMKNTTT